jgi:hypothetical protein
VASLLREQLNVDVALEPGSFGEFSVLAGEEVLTKRNLPFLPDEEEILESVRGYLNRSSKGAGSSPS